MPTLTSLLGGPDRPGPIVTPPRLPGCSHVVWQVLVRDGHLDEIREGYALVPGVAGTPELRARTFAEEIPAGVVLGRLWAAWVHTGGQAPRPGSGASARPCVVYRPGSSRPRAATGLDAVQASLRPWEVETVGELQVTTLVRTAMDVATWADDDDALRVLLRLAAAGVDLEGAAAQLDRGTGWRGGVQARRRLEGAAQARASGAPTEHPPQGPGDLSRG